jgi:hypothetical protein
VPEESINTPGPNDEAIRRLERRIESLEYAAQQENRWWRGGLIAALVLVALSILIAGHHRRHRPPPVGPMGPMGQMGQMGMMGGWQRQRMMPYGPPPPPPNWGYGPGRNYGPSDRWNHRYWDAPESEGQPPPPKN